MPYTRSRCSSHRTSRAQPCATCRPRSISSASVPNFLLLGGVCALLVLSLDWLFFYEMPGYSGTLRRYLWVVLPSAAMSLPVCWLLFGWVRRIWEEFKIDNGVV